MSALTERGANSSSMNLMNSSTRFPDGAAMQNPRTGKVLSAGFSAAARFKAPARSRQSHFSIAFMIGASARHNTQFLRRLPGWLFRVFRLDDFAHELRGKLRVFVCEFNSDGFAVYHRQLMAKLVAGVTVIVDLPHGPREVAIVLVRLASDGAINAVHAGDAAVGIAVELAAKGRHHLHGADRLRGFPPRPRALVRH